MQLKQTVSWDQIQVIPVSANKSMIFLIEWSYQWRLFQELGSKAKALQDKHDDLKIEIAQRQLDVRYLMQQ